jgi:hypothetical protein
MLSLANSADAATTTRMPFRMGALFVGGCTALPRVRATDTVIAAAAAEAVFADPHPRPVAGPVILGNATHEARQEKSAWPQPTSQKYAHTTRIAAAGGGALGPHPARDPV